MLATREAAFPDDPAPVFPRACAAAPLCSSCRRGCDGCPAQLPHPLRFAGRRSAPGLTTPSKDESTPLQTTPNSPREIPEEIINGSKGDHSVAEVFDADMLTKLSSDLWNEREQALQNIDKRVKSHDDYSSADKMPLFNACCCILRKGTADKVAPVFFAACALLESITDSSFAGSIPADDVQVWPPAPRLPPCAARAHRSAAVVPAHGECSATAQ